MSTDDPSLEPEKGPVVNAGGIQSWAGTSAGLPDQTSYRRVLGNQYDGDRQLYDVLGYRQKLKLEHYVAKYKRGPGIATALVDKPVRDSWNGNVEITEADDTETDETSFEKEVEKFINGDYTRLRPASRFKAADRWARLLDFSLILIGVTDDNVSNGRASDLEKEVDESSISGLEDISYLAIYDQRDVNWDDTELVDNPTDPRFRLPETYNIDIDDETTVDVHHSRLIHIVENPDESELKSPSIYKPIYNRIEDLQKLYGGSAEMFWRSAYPGLVMTPPTDAEGVPMKFDDDGESVAQQIKSYRHNLDRLLRVTGNVKKLDTNVASPDKQVDVQIQDMSAYIDMPMSIIRGNETGERATEQDLEMYHEFVGNRQREHCETQILRPLIDRFLEWGAIPSTLSGDEDTNSYDVEWPAKEEPTEREKAEVAKIWSQAFKNATAGSPQRAFSFPEIRRKGFGMDPEIGSEAPDSTDPEELAAEQVEVPAEQDTPENTPQ